MEILYGNELHYVNVTRKILCSSWFNDGILSIPDAIGKKNLLGDSLPDIVKHIKIIWSTGVHNIIYEYSTEILKIHPSEIKEKSKEIPIIPIIKSSKGIERIIICNASNVTTELPMALLNVISKYYYNVSISNIIRYDDPTTLYIIICPAGLNSDIYVRSPIYYVTYQLEPTIILHKITYRKYLEEALCNWDYSRNNVEYLSQYPAIKSVYVPVGYDISITHHSIITGNYIYNDYNKDIDVLLLGWDIYPRRLKIKEGLLSHGIKAVFICGLNLYQMGEYIQRSKICINISSSEHINCLESIRLNILLSNQACVVCEENDMRELSIYKDRVIITPYSHLITTCIELLKDSVKRQAIALNSYEWYRNSRIWTDIVDFKSLLSDVL